MARSTSGEADRPRTSLLATEADRGIVELPLLAPHLEFRPLGEDVAMLVSEGASTLLHGRRYLDLLPLLDGRRTRREIAARLAGKHAPLEVQTALVALASKGHVVSAEFSMERPMAAFWCALGATPRFAGQRLAAARVALAGDDGRLAGQLEKLGLAVAADAATLAVIRTAHYLDRAHGEVNRRHLASGIPWMLAKTDGVAPLFGPVFRPGEGGAPCWACLAHRLRGNNKVENFLRATAGETVGAVLPHAIAPPFADAVVGLAATEIAKWIVFGKLAPLHGHAISLTPLRAHIAAHPVMRRPQCPCCGDQALYRPDRKPTPVRLRPSPKRVRNSGGLRSLPPQETLRRYRHLIDPVSGVVTELTPIAAQDDPWLHVYGAGSNPALRGTSLATLRNGLRTGNCGKGSTPEQARASALCEAVERYSGTFHGDEIRRHACFVDFAAGEAIHPNAIMHYSERQYGRAEGADGGDRIPERFDTGAWMDFSPLWSFTRECWRWLPTSMLYFSTPREGKLYCPPDSNGCAAGNTLEEAILQGFFELAERDAFACWWYNRIRLPEMVLESFDDSWLAGAQDYYAAHHRELWLLDATNDLGVPVFIAISRRTDKKAEDILYAAGAHSDPQIAAARAVCELNQYLGTVRTAKADGSGYLADDPQALWWWRHVRIADRPWLAPAAAAGRRRSDRYPVPATGDLRDEVERCRRLVEARGMEFLVLDQTRPDIGMPVARTVVPGLRHFWARFAPGRLYHVPVAMGWLDKPNGEDDLNPFRVFI